MCNDCLLVRQLFRSISIHGLSFYPSLFKADYIFNSLVAKKKKRTVATAYSFSKTTVLTYSHNIF